jgi:hypothetical protein
VSGNVLTRADANVNLTETFKYDNLNRVTQAASTLIPLASYAACA